MKIKIKDAEEEGKKHKKVKQIKVEKKPVIKKAEPVLEKVNPPLPIPPRRDGVEARKLKPWEKKARASEPVLTDERKTEVVEEKSTIAYAPP